MWPITGSMAERRRSSRLMMPKTPRFCSGDEGGALVVRVMTAVTLVDIAAVDFAVCEFLSLLDDLAQGMPVVWVVRQRPGVQHEPAARRAGVGGDNRNLDVELVGRTGLALADAFGLGGLEGIQLPAALALLLGSDLGGAQGGRTLPRCPRGLRSCCRCHGSAGPDACAGCAVLDGIPIFQAIS